MNANSIVIRTHHSLLRSRPTANQATPTTQQTVHPHQALASTPIRPLPSLPAHLHSQPPRACPNDQATQLATTTPDSLPSLPSPARQQWTSSWPVPQGMATTSTISSAWQRLVSDPARPRRTPRRPRHLLGKAARRNPRRRRDGWSTEIRTSVPRRGWPRCPSMLGRLRHQHRIWVEGGEVGG